jgi:hypothetical protein
MPKLSKYPRLRTHTRKGRGGQVWTSWYYDMRSEGQPDIALGSDYETALVKWDEIHNQKPRIKGTIEEAFIAWERDVLPNYRSDETRKGYTRDLGKLRPVFGPATWDSITFATLKAYLKKRTAKTRANREMSLFSIVWNYARGEGLTTLPWPAAGMERSRWKNKEQAREFEVTSELFDAVYEFGDQVLRDVMDLSTATGMRLTDCRAVKLPPGDLLPVKASKTNKGASFDVSLSEVLPGLLARRREAKVVHLNLITTPSGKQLSARMLRDRYDAAREKAAAKAREAGNEAFAKDIEAMWLRDMRKRASDLAESDEAASKLLQHSSVAVTRKHYRTRGPVLKPVR